VSLLAWIALGFVVGAVAGWLLGQRGRMLVASIVVATLGAILGGFMTAVMLGLDVSGLDLTSLIMAALGAVFLVIVLRALPPAGPLSLEEEEN
jgi:uncharacterized membrane protein YeaQ/YmgE (transglycosylase-associated protein family)